MNRPPNSHGCPMVAVCSGKHCRRDPSFAGLVNVVEHTASLVTVSCVDVCSAPVVVVDPLGSPVVLSKVTGKKTIRDLGDWLAGGGTPSRRVRRLVTSGKSARKAATRAQRSLRRAAA